MNDQLVTEITRRAMATEFGIALPGEDRTAIEAAMDALEQLEPIEAALSLYRPDSDIARVNLAAGGPPVRVGPHTLNVLSRAVALHRLTAGAFDVTAGPLIECWGFTRRRGKKPSEQEIQAARALIGSDAIELDVAHRTVRLPRPGMAINLGAIGKGYALDRIATHLRAAGQSAFLIHGGRSSILAAGSDSAGPHAGWQIAIEHPLRPGQRLGILRLKDAALATSGSGKQFFHHRGQRMGHVLDPRTGYPAAGMLAISVISETAIDADALATACLVAGVDATAAQLQADAPPAGPHPTATKLEAAVAAEPRWPLAAVAVLEQQRQGELAVLPLGATERLVWQPQ